VNPRHTCPACGTPNALLLRHGIGGVLVLCANGCPREAILGDESEGGHSISTGTRAAAPLPTHGEKNHESRWG
jgi:hypothetical protein